MMQSCVAGHYSMLQQTLASPQRKPAVANALRVVARADNVQVNKNIMCALMPIDAGKSAWQPEQRSAVV